MPYTLEANHLINSAQILEKYLPKSVAMDVAQLLYVPRLQFKITRPRKSKFGDYTFDRSTGNHRITINSNLNPYAFLVTTLHEVAHLRVTLNYKGNRKPHGKEWQHEFRVLLTDFMERVNFPEDIEQALIDYLRKPAASSCSDPFLYKALLNYNTIKEVLLEEIPEGTVFSTGNKIFIKGKKRVKRYLCVENKTNKPYLVHALTEVQVISVPLL